MAAYKQAKRHAFQTDVTDRQGRTRKGCSCGTSSAKVAADMDRALRRWRESRTVGGPILAAIVDGELALVDAYEADLDGKLEATLHAVEHARASALATARLVDLDPLVTQWASEQSVRDVTVAYVRRFVDHAPFPVADFSRGAVARFLGALRTVPRRERRIGETDAQFAFDATRPASGATKNRYRAALRSFARWLVEREVLNDNPVRDVRGFAEADPRMVHLSEADARRLVDALPTPELSALAALMANGIEWGAIAAARCGDVDTARWTFQPFAAVGMKGKTRWRSQRRALGWEWTHRHIAMWCDIGKATEQVTHLRSEYVLDQQLAACERLGLPRHTLHDWRHTYAVHVLTAPGPEPMHTRLAALRRQLGHAPNSMTALRVYAAFIDAAPSGEGEG